MEPVHSAATIKRADTHFFWRCQDVTPAYIENACYIVRSIEKAAGIETGIQLVDEADGAMYVYFDDNPDLHFGHPHQAFIDAQPAKARQLLMTGDVTFAGISNWLTRKGAGQGSFDTGPGYANFAARLFFSILAGEHCKVLDGDGAVTNRFRPPENTNGLLWFADWPHRLKPAVEQHWFSGEVFVRYDTTALADGDTPVW